MKSVSKMKAQQAAQVAAVKTWTSIASPLLFIFGAVYVVYHLTLLPSTPGGDSGELLAEACLLGTPHPPGYPLFTMLASLAMRMPFPRAYFADGYSSLVTTLASTKAWRVNHLCCLLGATTAALLASSSHMLFSVMARCKSRLSPACCLGALLFCLSPLVWEYSLSAEVFALNNFLCALLVHLTCKALTVADDEREFYLFGGALCAGAALSNQHASLLSLAPLVVAVLAATAPSLAARQRLASTLAISAALFLLPLTSYLYLHLAALRPTPGSWGNLQTAGGLLRHVLRAEYGTFQLGMTRENSESAAQRLWLYLQHVDGESGHVLTLAVPAAVVGCFWLRKLAPPAPPAPADTLPWALLTSWVIYTAVWHCVLSNIPLSSPMPFGVHARFWMQPNLFLCVAAGAGANALSAWVLLGAQRLGGRAKAKKADTHNPAAEALDSPWGLALEWAALLAALGVLISARFSAMDKSKSGWIMHTYARGALESLPPDSLLLAHTDLDWNPMRYMRECEGARPDVTHLSFQMMPYPWFSEVQRPLYPKVTFPDLGFPGVSTARHSEGNAHLVRSVLLANGVMSHTAHSLEIEAGRASAQVDRGSDWTAFPGGIYMDMQAINDVEIGDGHVWRGLTLAPWGTLYRVFTAMPLEATAELHSASLAQLRLLETRMPALSAALVRQYPRGTWEHAALSVVNDARYQLAMSLLTFSIAYQPMALSPERLPVLCLLLDRLHASATLFSSVLVAAAGLPPGFSAAHASGIAQGYQALSSPLFDARKNGALAWMRLEQIFKLALDFRPGLIQALAVAKSTYQKSALNPTSPIDATPIEPVARPGMLLNLKIMDEVSPVGLAKVRQEGAAFIRAFLWAHGDDKDAPTFLAAAEKMEAASK